MDKFGIQVLAKDVLSDLLDMPGGILYSSHETLKAGDVYLLGFNPGGGVGNAISESIEGMLSNTKNAYLDQCWENESSSWAAGGAPLQRRVKWVFESLGMNLDQICASNLIFFQSRDAKGIDYSLADRCWPVHEAILKIVQPKIILVFGNSGVSPYGYLHSRYGGEQEFLPSGHGDWQVKGFSTCIGGHKIFVAGLPHLSRYDPGMANFTDEKKAVMSWLRSKLDA